ncbi:hypothetical protein GUITHDRAFT_166270 [Guillardia theta CCMP2712]|uniref:Uncharacterized protein n=2 Tax=Guillardia theta TaxID=55529 RepID=L1IED9_GUITC|nr:hypothetical protein GUITHDRAFT_166270 [Guillardia theta CCMP2712]EKX34195.1 hypothetical protein GUITHDRAFT_166270 [Guillardia theta CCMP2712]|mmetsp:Transcript_46095/g.144614  ORF Transcript_46095/g.144614 Transcript_46095/m.144614 type:complete len:345 (+) Transcript_46095:120-1154(+)|eukprot:XP_005821175.1 hypothetical protein GUITHDRAFT_166270 [Guillardia theta CCMP2712]
MKTCRKDKPVSPPGKLAYEEDIFVCTISMNLRTSSLRASDDDDACLFSKQSVRRSPIKSPSRAAKKQSTTRGRKQEASRQHVKIERSRKKVEERKRKRPSEAGDTRASKAAKRSPRKSDESKEETWFAIVVDDEWRDQKGFMLWEVTADVAEDGTVKAREWYCAAELEPEGGFEFGHQRFLPKQSNFAQKRRLLGRSTQTFLRVDVRRKMVGHPNKKHGKKMFCEIDKEQLRVQEAYCLLDKKLGVEEEREEEQEQEHVDEDWGWPDTDGKTLMTLKRSEWPGPAPGIISTSLVNPAYIRSEVARWAGEREKREVLSVRNPQGLIGFPRSSWPAEGRGGGGRNL